MGILYTSTLLSGTSLPEVNFPTPGGSQGLLLTNNSVWDLTVFSPLWNLTVPSYSVATMPASGNLQVTVKGLSKDTTLIALSNASVSWGSSNIPVPLNITPIASKAVVPIQITSGTVDVTIQNATLDTHSTVQNDLLSVNPMPINSTDNASGAATGNTFAGPSGAGQVFTVDVSLPLGLYDSLFFALKSTDNQIPNYTVEILHVAYTQLSLFVENPDQTLTPISSSDEVGMYYPATLSPPVPLNQVSVQFTTKTNWSGSDTMDVYVFARYATASTGFEAADDTVAELFINSAAPNTDYYLGGNTNPTAFSKPVRAIRLQGLMASGTTVYTLLLTFTDTSKNELAQFQTFMSTNPTGGMSLDFPRGYWPGSPNENYYVYISGGSAGAPNFTTVGEMIY